MISMSKGVRVHVSVSVTINVGGAVRIVASLRRIALAPPPNISIHVSTCLSTSNEYAYITVCSSTSASLPSSFILVRRHVLTCILYFYSVA